MRHYFRQQALWGHLRPLLRYFAKHIEIFLISSLVVVAMIQFYVRPQSQSYDEIIESGVLRVLITDEPDSQYVFNKQHYGFEYELLAAFAQSLDVELEMKVVPYGEIFTLLNNGVADMAVGGIVDTDYVRNVSKPSIAWYEAKTTVVYKRGGEHPSEIADFDGQPIHSSARYFGLEALKELNIVDDYQSEYELMNAVASGEEQYALTVNYRAMNAKHYLPELNRSFILPEKLDVVWVLPKNSDSVLAGVLDQFFEIALQKKLPTKLADYYLGLPNRLTTFDALAVQKHIRTRLPEYELAFRMEARKADLDWFLLAAMAYQESRWVNSARSPTGVRGLMQLTQQTAEFLKIDDRTDPQQSIGAAARYMEFLKSKLPKLIKEPERTWFAVGAYNMGLRHILNAYRSAREKGLDRTRWAVVSQLLPGLYGEPFSQGQQAQDYVNRVQIFTDILRFYDLHQRHGPQNTDTAAVEEKAGEDRKSESLNEL